MTWPLCDQRLVTLARSLLMADPIALPSIAKTRVLLRHGPVRDPIGLQLGVVTSEVEAFDMPRSPAPYLASFPGIGQFFLRDRTGFFTLT